MRRLLFLLCFAASHAFAGLTWTRTEVQITAKPDDTIATGVYPFKNETGQKITITNTKTSCGCTTAKLEKKTYAPGESGEILAHFDIGDRVGPQQKTITVTTDDEKEKPVELQLNVDIPDSIEASPNLLAWAIGATPTEQVFTVRAKDETKIHVKDIRCSNAFFTAKLDSAKEGEVYHITVTPVKTAAKVFGLLIVTTDYPVSHPRVVYAQLQVR